MKQNGKNLQPRAGPRADANDWYVPEPAKQDGPLARLFAGVVVTLIGGVVGIGLGFLIWMDTFDGDGSPRIFVIIGILTGLLGGAFLAYLIDRAMNVGDRKAIATLDSLVRGDDDD